MIKFIWKKTLVSIIHQFWIYSGNTKKKAASIIALVCGSERYAKGLKETLQFISDQIMLFYTPESAKTRLGRHKPDLWIVTEDMTSQPNQPWRADRTTPVILITGNPDAVEIKRIQEN